MKILYNKKPARLFTFGCSFTKFWQWGTWANILAYDLDIPFYNLGRGGAGNSYIANRITQADTHYKFTKDDLVLVCWSTYAREDRWTRHGWIGNGNVHNDETYPKDFVMNFCSDEHFFLKDMSLIKLVDGYLENKTTCHMFSVDRLVPYGLENFLKSQQTIFNKISPSYADMIYGGNLRNAITPVDQDLKDSKIDNHPTLIQHLEYLEKIFATPVSTATRKHVVNTYNKWKEWILSNSIPESEVDIPEEFYIKHPDDLDQDIV